MRPPYANQKQQQRLVYFCLDRGMRACLIAELLNETASTVSMWRHGKTKIPVNLDPVVTVSKHLGTSLLQLIEHVRGTQEQVWESR